MDKLDIKKTLKPLYSARAGAFVIVDVPPLTYFMIDGAGNPNAAPAYSTAVEALYAASYTLKFMSKDMNGQDYVVPPLEGLWWARDMSDFAARRKDRWLWTMMMLVPDFIPRSMAQQAIAKAVARKALPALQALRVDRLDEGESVQILHVGGYDDEGPALKALHDEFLPANGLIETGHHHEIYLGDPRKAAVDKLRTILRQPVRAKS